MLTLEGLSGLAASAAISSAWPDPTGSSALPDWPWRACELLPGLWNLPSLRVGSPPLLPVIRTTITLGRRQIVMFTFLAMTDRAVGVNIESFLEGIRSLVVLSHRHVNVAFP